MVKLSGPVARRLAALALVLVSLPGGCGASLASNRLDTPAVISHPQANIRDIYAWTARDGRRLNRVMDVVGHSLSVKLSYVFVSPCRLHPMASLYGWPVASPSAQEKRSADRLSTRRPSHGRAALTV
jgi:hypothetical protein